MKSAPVSLPPAPRTSSRKTHILALLPVSLSLLLPLAPSLHQIDKESREQAANGTCVHTLVFSAGDGGSQKRNVRMT